MPTYSNDFPDWDADDWIPFSIPQVPLFLALCAVSLLLALLVTAVTFARSKKKPPTHQLAYSAVRDQE